MPRCQLNNKRITLKRFCGEFCVISLFLLKLILGVRDVFDIVSVHLSLPLFNFTQEKDKCALYLFTTKKLTHSRCQVFLVVKYRLCLTLIILTSNQGS